MDLSYILLNTIVYGSLAMVIAWFSWFGKILNFSLGAYMIMGWYIIHRIINYWINIENIIMIIIFFGSFLLINRWLLKYFENDKKRDHVWLVLTLWLSIVLENIIGYIYWPTSISLELWQIPTYWFIIIFIILSLFFFYIYRHTIIWTILNAISENSKLVRGLWIRTNKTLQIVFILLLFLLLWAVVLILNESSIRASDGIFYIIKWIGIMILVGISKKEYMFLGALLYVLIEYLLFIKIWFPIAYKETLILLIILAVLLFKPEWLFTLKWRKI